jgi:hypothetical protein
MTALRAERHEELVHSASRGGVCSFVVDAVGEGEGEVALAEGEVDLDGVAVQGADLLARGDGLAWVDGWRDAFGDVGVVAGVGAGGELVGDPAVAVAPA